MEADMKTVIKEYAAMDAVASQILSDKHQVISIIRSIGEYLSLVLHFFVDR